MGEREGRRESLRGRERERPVFLTWTVNNFLYSDWLNSVHGR